MLYCHSTTPVTKYGITAALEGCSFSCFNVYANKDGLLWQLFCLTSGEPSRINDVVVLDGNLKMGFAYRTAQRETISNTYAEENKVVGGLKRSRPGLRVIGWKWYSVINRVASSTVNAQVDTEVLDVSRSMRKECSHFSSGENWSAQPYGQPGSQSWVKIYGGNWEKWSVTRLRPHLSRTCCTRLLQPYWRRILCFWEVQASEFQLSNLVLIVPSCN